MACFQSSSDAALVAEAETLSSVQGILKLLLAFIHKKTRLFRDLTQQVSAHGLL